MRKDWMWAIISLVIAVVLAYILVSLARDAESKDDPYAPIACVPDKETKDRILAILTEATETALKNHVVHMHEIWMRDEKGQPERASNGTRQGLRAFIGGRQFLKKWDVPICPNPQ